MRLYLRPAIAAAILWAAGLSLASADPVTITSGSITVTGATGFSPVQLQGTDGVSPFTFTGGIAPDSIIAVRHCSINPCGLTETSLSLAINSSGGDMPGTLIYGEDSYRVGGTSDSVGSLIFLISGFVLLPPPPSAVDLVATLTGGFQLDPSSRFTRPIDGGPFQHSGALLSGAGLATVTLGTEVVSGVPHWVFRTAEYRFGDTVPTPEPASMVLLFSGLVGIALQRRRRGRATRRSEPG